MPEIAALPAHSSSQLIDIQYTLTKTQRKNLKKRQQKQKMRELRQAELTNSIKLQLAGYNLHYHNPAHYPELPYDDVPTTSNTSSADKITQPKSTLSAPSQLNTTFSQGTAKKRKHDDQQQDGDIKKTKPKTDDSNAQFQVSQPPSRSSDAGEPSSSVSHHQSHPTSKRPIQEQSGNSAEQTLASQNSERQITVSGHPDGSFTIKTPELTPLSARLPPNPVAVPRPPRDQSTPTIETSSTPIVRSTLTVETTAVAVSSSTSVSTRQRSTKSISAAMFELRVKELKLIMSQIERAKNPEDRKILTSRWKSKNRELSMLSVAAPSPAARAASHANGSGLPAVIIEKSSAPVVHHPSLFMRQGKFLDIPFLSSLVIDISDSEDEDDDDEEEEVDLLC
ncbi:hypothetical protein FRC03_005733 [Tulasnella sp. 419]|nr:hypothetical protein FRC03_005733 [Tulasnella sp. 419]